ncbi:MAG: protoporphyrinogen oxidase [Bryobacteraceae bacterium]
MKAPIIIGGGISGLSAAYYLAKAGIQPVLIEQSARLGGVIQTESVDGCLVEGGPDSFLTAKPAATELIGELGLGGELMGSNDHARVTYILRRGRLIAMPEGLMMMAPTRIWPMARTRLLSWPAKLRMGLEYFRHAAAAPLAERSVADFIADHYGAEALDYLAEPLLAGVYGGDPAQLSAPAVLTRFVEMETRYGSLTRGALATRKGAGARAAPLFQTLKSGMARLIAELERRTPPPLHGTAETIERSGAGYRVRVNGGWMEAGRVVVATPAWSAAALLKNADPALAHTLASIPYSSSLTLALGYAQTDFPRALAGFGFLVPKRERERMVACTWVGTKFAHRAPDGRVLLRCFFGGEADPAILNETDESLVAIARRELARIMRLDAPPTFFRVSRWPRSMAQYTVGHRGRIAEIEARAAQLPGLSLAGNAYRGIGIPDCIRMGKEAAARIAADAWPAHG